MVTAVATSAGTAGMNPSPAQEPVLSDLAQATLDRLGQVHAEFTQTTEAFNVQASAATTPAAEGPGGEIVQAAGSLGESFRAATRLQGQIVQFSMATSISQSLGNNLNSFLKGA